MWLRTVLGYMLLVPGLLRLGFEGALLIGRLWGLYQPMQETTIFGALLKLFPASILILLAMWVLRSRYSETDLLAAATVVAGGNENEYQATSVDDDIARSYRVLSLRELLSIRNAIDGQAFPGRYHALNREIGRRAKGGQASG